VGIQVVAYSSICRGGKRKKGGEIIDVLQDKLILELSKKYNK